MGFYAKRILPPLLNVAMKQSLLVKYREAVVSGAEGDVVEIGIGSGLNLPFYRNARSVTGIDPSPELLGMAERQAKRARPVVHLLEGSAAALPFPDASFDVVVMTWSLCSIPDPAAALVEMRRVLRPAGQLRFVEHGQAPEPRVRAFQNRLTPIWRRVAGGCHLDRRIDDLIATNGFDLRALETGYAGGPRFATFMYQGHAVPR